jgi:hypothetical protein
MKTICILLRSTDQYCLKKIINKNRNNKNFIVIAPTLEGQLAALNLKVRFFSCEEIAWNLDILKINKISSKCAYDILINSNIKINSKNKYFNNNFCKRYPLLKMHYSLLLYSFIDVVNSWEYANGIINHFKPAKIIISTTNNPYDFYENRLAPITGRGSEHKAFKIAAKNRSIFVEEIPQKNNLYYKVILRFKNFYRFFREVCKFIYYSVFHYSLFIFYKLFFRRHRNKKKINKVIINCISPNDYYFDQIKNYLFLSGNNDYDIYLNFEDKNISFRDYLFFYKNGINIISGIYKLLLFIKISFFLKKKKINTVNITKDIYYKIISHLANSKLFIDKYGTYKEMAFLPLKKEILFGLRFTIKKLFINELIVKYFSPKIVISQFDLHALESANILPAINKKILSLGMCHGFGGVLDYIRYSYVSDFIAVTGSKVKNIISKIIKTSKNKIFLLPDLRIIKMFSSINDKNKNKISLGLDPNRPVCIICDQSGWLTSYQFRNSEIKNFNEIIKIKEKIRDLQIIVRVHHGINYSTIKKYLDRFKIKDIHFQVSSDLEFSELVKAADVVVAHFCSAIIESIASGVPVIYLNALSYVDKNVCGHDQIHIINSHKLLIKKIKYLIKKKYSQSHVRKKSRLFLKNYANIHYSHKNQNLHNIINKLLTLKNNRKKVKTYEFEKRIYKLANLDYQF